MKEIKELKNQICLYQNKIKKLAADFSIFVPESDTNILSNNTELKIVIDNKHFEKISHGVYLSLCSLNNLEHLNITISNEIFEPNGRLEPHYHDRHERVHIIHGELTELITNKTYKEGDSIFTPAKQLHGFESKNGCLLTITWQPAFPMEAIENEIK